MPKLLRIPYEKVNTDEEDCVLLHISHRGPHELDLDLTATENTRVFEARLDRDKVHQLQAKECTDSALWSSALRTLLLAKKPEKKYRDVLKGLLYPASRDGKKLNVKLAHKVGGINIKLGMIVLEEGDESSLDLFRWAGVAVERQLHIERELERSQEALLAEQHKTKRLDTQLNDIILRKKRNEDELLEKFRQLLNSKKLKIRDQQRLLAGAIVNPETVASVGAARAKTNGRPTGRSNGKGRGKRVIKEECEDDDEDQTMGSDGDTNAASRAVTPDRSETESEPDDLEKRPASGVDFGSSATAPLDSQCANKSNQKLNATTAEDDDETTDDEIIM